MMTMIWCYMVWYDDDNVWVICIQWYVQTIMYNYMYTCVCTSIFLCTMDLWSILYDDALPCCDEHSMMHTLLYMLWCDDVMMHTTLCTLWCTCMPWCDDTLLCTMMYTCRWCINDAHYMMMMMYTLCYRPWWLSDLDDDMFRPWCLMTW